MRRKTGETWAVMELLDDVQEAARRDTLNLLMNSFLSLMHSRKKQ